MTENSSAQVPPSDHGRVVKARRFRVSLAWLFPVLAAAATAWLFWTHWKERGPEIEIEFPDAPGIQAGKTALFYRGVNSGKVTEVKLDSTLGGVIVKVQLKAFAAELAREHTDFWIDQPEISLQQMTGLDAIIQGNSIQARLGHGPFATRFKGLSGPPLLELDKPARVFTLHADKAPFVARGTPVLHHGVQVGSVRDKGLEKDGRVWLRVVVDAEHAHAVLDTSRFWFVPAASLHLSGRGASIDLPSLAALVDGGIAFDSFVPGGKPVPDHAELPLAPNEAAARADGPTIQITFDTGEGVTAGETRVCWLGQPVGLVRAVRLDPATASVEATVQLESPFVSLARAGSVFTLVRPSISLQGVSGLETIVTGPYIACKPATGGAPATQFAGRTVTDEEWNKSVAERDGLRVVLTAPELPTIERGAPVYHRGLVVGTVLEKFLSTNGQPSLRIVVRAEYRDALRANSRFWRVPATSVAAGPGVLDVRVSGLLGLLQGGIAFDAFGDNGAPAQEASTFPLFDNETLASAVSAPVRITFADGRGLLAARTQLRYLGVPVGVVEDVQTKDGRITAVARLQTGFEFLRRAGSAFTLVKPEVSLQGVSGLETLVSGVYIDCQPGTGPGLAETFAGRTSADPESLERKGFPIRVTTPQTAIRPGALVTYRETRVGEVIGKTLAPDGSLVILDVLIDEEQRDLVRQNSVFWDASAIDGSLGFIKFRIHTPLLIAAEGRLAFSNPPHSPAPPAKRGTTFELQRRPRF
jgi:paraquat-inducible protein B